MDISNEKQGPEMWLVVAEKKYEEEGFRRAVKLSEAYNEKIKGLLAIENKKIRGLLEIENNQNLREEIENKMLKFVPEIEHNDVFVKDEDGIEEILLEIIGKQGETMQQPFIADFHGVKDALNFIWFSRCPSQSL